MSLRDPGLQPERTALAWRRTGLSALVTAALLLRAGPLGVVGAACAVALAVTAWCAGQHPAHHGSPRWILLVTAAAAGAAGVSAVGFVLERRMG
jgi:hypothetical protein